MKQVPVSVGQDDVLDQPDSNLTKVTGKVLVSEAAKAITVTLPGHTDLYSVIDLDESECVLVKGPIRSADLSQSWFGTVIDDPGADDRD
jgi:hypothetical protein